MSLEQHNDADKKEVSEQKNAAQNQAAIMYVSQDEIVVKVDNINFVRMLTF